MLKAGYETTFQPSQNDVNSKLNIEIAQALGENAFGLINKLDDKIINFKNEIIKYEIIEAYEYYLAKIIGIYYDWFKAY